MIFFSIFGISGADRYDIDCNFLCLCILDTKYNPPSIPTLVKKSEICSEYSHSRSNGKGDNRQKCPKN